MINVNEIADKCVFMLCGLKHVYKKSIYYCIDNVCHANGYIIDDAIKKDIYEKTIVRLQEINRYLKEKGNMIND